MNRSGKTLTIFLSVMVLVFLCFTGIVLFLLVKEKEFRKTAETNAERLQMAEAKLQADLKESKKQGFLLEEKNKEVSDKIENLMEDLDLAEGLRDEIKKENRQLKEDLEKETQLKEDLRKQLASAEDKVGSLQQQLQTTADQNQELTQSQKNLQSQYEELKKKLESPWDTSTAMQNGQPSSMDLERIVVGPSGEKKGKIVSIDRETNFLIVSLGEKDGIRKDMMLSIYRKDNHIGDVKVSRVLPEMSAVDFIPPLKSQDIVKDDWVVMKQ